MNVASMWQEIPGQARNEGRKDRNEGLGDRNEGLGGRNEGGWSPLTLIPPSSRARHGISRDLILDNN